MNAIFQTDKHTIGEFISAVCRIDNEADAKQFAVEYLEWLKLHADGKHKPEDVLRANIGWCFGEGMSQERIEMWRKVCNASHPFFGTTLPSMDQALAIGRGLGTKP